MTGDDLADLQRVTADSLRRFGLADADQIAAWLMKDLRRELAGCSVYVSKGFQARNQEIRLAFNGRNAAKLAAQYGITRRRVDQIVSNP